MRSDGRPDTAEMTLALRAWRYAAGELPPAEAAAFAARLSTDAAAQDALGLSRSAFYKLLSKAKEHLHALMVEAAT